MLFVRYQDDVLVTAEVSGGYVIVYMEYLDSVKSLSKEAYFLQIPYYLEGIISRELQTFKEEIAIH